MKVLSALYLYGERERDEKGLLHCKNEGNEGKFGQVRLLSPRLKHEMCTNIHLC